MKKILLSLSIVTLLFSCSSNDSDEPKNNNEDLNAVVVEKSITIQGATKKTGTPPASNGDLSFETKASVANIEEGFFIEIDTQDEIDGVYIQLLDENKNPVDNYIDVPATSFVNTDGIIEPNFGAGATNKTKKVDDDADLIDVDFGIDLAPGEFCYIICIYDEETGYVSAPTEICVTVIDWGGNNDFAGTWIPNPDEDDNEFIDSCIEFNEFYPAIECNNGTEFKPEGEICFDYLFELDLEASGDFVYDIAWDYKTLDIASSEEQCTTVFENIKFDFSYHGKWSYDASSKILTLVLNAITFEGETIPYEEGVLLYSDIATVEDGKLVLGDDDFINQYFIRK